MILIRYNFFFEISSDFLKLKLIIISKLVLLFSITGQNKFEVCFSNLMLIRAIESALHAANVFVTLQTIIYSQRAE